MLKTRVPVNYQDIHGLTTTASDILHLGMFDSLKIATLRIEHSPNSDETLNAL